MDDKQIRYLPFHAINEFMLPEYRHSVLQTVLGQLDKLSNERRSALNNLIKRYIQVPGFRNSAQAPLGVRVRNAASPFERRADFTAQVLQGWSELHVELAQQVYDLLAERGWEKLLPSGADRAKLPGFMTSWPKADTYDVLDAAFAAKYPEAVFEAYDMRLMVVWIANRLPYELFLDEEEGEEEEAV
jgi:hypothetical protein